MPKPRFQFSLKTLLIATILASAVLGTAVSLYIQRRNDDQLFQGKWVIHYALCNCQSRARQRLGLIWSAEDDTFHGNDLDFLINERHDKRGKLITEDLVNLHLHLAQFGGKLTCEISIKGGQDAQTFVNDLSVQLKTHEIAVSVKEPS